MNTINLPVSGSSSCGNTAGSDTVDVLLQRLHDQSLKDPRNFEKEILAVVSRVDPAQAANLIVGMHSAELLRSSGFLDEICQIFVPLVARFPNVHLSRVLVALAAWTRGLNEGGRVRLSESVRVCFAAISRELMLQMMDSAPADLCSVTTALLSVGMAESTFFSALSRVSLSRVDRFTLRELLSLMEAFDGARFLHVSLLEAFTRCVRQNVKEATAADLLSTMKVLAASCVRDEDLARAIEQAVSDNAELTAEEFCTLAWTFCILGFRHDRTFQTAFRALKGTMFVGSETLCQLFEIHVSLKMFHWDSSDCQIEEGTVDSLREHYKKHRGGRKGAYKLDRSSEQIHDDVADTLREVFDGSVHRQHQTECGFFVDVAVRRKSLVVALDIDGHQDLMRPLDNSTTRVRGATFLKRRVLQQSGVPLAVLTEDVWRTLDDRGKRDLLREILKIAGD